MRIIHYPAYFLIATAVFLAGCDIRRTPDRVVVERSSGMYGIAAPAVDDAAAAGQPVAPLSTLSDDATLDDYVAFGLKHNPTLRAAFERWKAATTRGLQVRTLPDPRLSLTYFVEPIETRTGPQRAQAKVSQKFPWPGKLKLAGDIADTRAESLWRRVRSERLRVIRRIKTAYYEYAFLGQSITITRDSLTLLKQLEPIVQTAVASGGKFADLLKLQVEIGRLDNTLQTLLSYRTALDARLKAALNYAGDTPLPFPPDESIDMTQPDREKLLAAMLEKNPDLNALRKMIKMNALTVRRAELDGLPDVSVGVVYLETGEATRSLADSGNDPVGVNLSLNLPIQRGKYDAAVREAKRNTFAAKATLAGKKNALAAELDSLLFKLDDARRQAILYKNTLLPRAREAYEVTQTAYLSGSASILDLIDSERMLLTFDKAYRRAVSNYAQRMADIEALCGGSLK